MKVSIFFAWYDFWVGFFWDRQKHILYICPLPMVVVKLKFERKPMSFTTDPHDPRLGHGSDTEPKPQNEVYLILSEEERAKGFVRPVRNSYIHLTCGTVTSMGKALAETYARNPKLYGATYCVYCQMHKPVSEFVWSDDRTPVGS